MYMQYVKNEEENKEDTLKKNRLLHFVEGAAERPDVNSFVVRLILEYLRRHAY